MFNDQDYMFNLRNISINGRKTGCSGYIYNPSTGLVLYVNTEKSVASWLKETMVRYVSFQEETRKISRSQDLQSDEWWEDGFSDIGITVSPKVKLWIEGFNLALEQLERAGEQSHEYSN